MDLRDLTPILLCGISVPISLFFWLGNVTISKVWNNTYEEAVIPPSRWLFSTIAPFTLMIIALRRKSVNKSGAALGVIIAFILSIANHAFFISLVSFFFSSSRATKYKSHIKRKFQENFKEGEGLRDWVQVFCNGGMATQLALLYLIDCGSSERPIDFISQYRASWLSIAVLSCFSCSNGDTWASELGSVSSKSEPFLITTLRRVPRGTNGGVSPLGLIFSLLGGLFVGIFYYISVCYTVNINILANSPPQWPIILFGGLAGFFGSIIDSLIGATLQYSAISKEGYIIDSPREDVSHISGVSILDNHSVNLISTIIIALLNPYLALKFWPVY